MAAWAATGSASFPRWAPRARRDETRSTALRLRRGSAQGDRREGGHEGRPYVRNPRPRLGRVNIRAYPRQSAAELTPSGPARELQEDAGGSPLRFTAGGGCAT